MENVFATEVVEKLVEQSPFAFFCIVMIIVLTYSHNKSKKLLERTFEKSLAEIKETYKNSMDFVERMTNVSKEEGGA